MFPECASRPDGAELHRRLVAAVGAAARELAALEPGRLVSLSVPLPFEVAMPSPASEGDSRWLCCHDGLRIHGVGQAACFDSDAAGRFGAACRRWHLLGPANPPPLAFFTIPPATEPATPRIWIPRIAVRRGGGFSGITLSAWWDGGSPEATARGWFDDAGRLAAGAETPRPAPPLRVLATDADPDDAAWDQRVRRAAEAVADGRLDKVVLARRLTSLLSRPVDPARITKALARAHPQCCVFSLPCGRGRVIAASPELLAVKRGNQLVSNAVAGTARRHGDPGEDAAAAAALVASVKERREHAVVVNAIASSLTEICHEVERRPEPHVMPLRFLQHLWTPITGRLRAGIGLIDVVTRLHPTPAVLGSPAQAAIDWLRDIGERRDGLYTGIAGWVDREGDGDAAVVLRSAYIEDRTAVLWAGAGIMADSDPRAELAETEMKLASLMEVLNAP